MLNVPDKPDHVLFLTLHRPDEVLIVAQDRRSPDDDVTGFLKFLTRRTSPWLTHFYPGAWKLVIRSHCYDYPPDCETPCSGNWTVTRTIYAGCAKEALTKAWKYEKWLNRQSWNRYDAIMEG